MSTDDIGLTDADRAILVEYADDPDADAIREAVGKRLHAERSSRFDWGPDPTKDYCGRCGTGLRKRWTVEAGGQRLDCCADCFERLRGRAVRGLIDLEVVERPRSVDGLGRSD